MLETINQLANLLVEKDPTHLRIAFNEEDRTKDPQPEAAHFLKFNLDGDERRMGRDFELYNFMAKVTGKGWLTATLLQELVMPLKGYSDEAFKHGIAFLRGCGNSFEADKRQEWDELLTKLSN